MCCSLDKEKIMLRKKFIKATDTYCSFENHVNAPYLRRSFALNFVPTRAQISICGLGFYRLWINGQEITKGLLAPYISNPDHYCYYDTYDVRERLHTGENVIGILLGNGFMNPFGGAVWDFDKADWKDAPKAALELKVQGEDQELVIEADEAFKVHPSPIVFDELRMGEHYDANLEIAGWNLPGFDDSIWEHALPAEAPRGEMKRCNAEPIRIQKRLKPVSVTKCEDGYLYDFGENTAGLTELNITAKPGQKIALWHCEILKDGKFYNDNIIFHDPKYGFYKEYNQKTVYIAKGEMKESYLPSFTYYGFRYVLVQGITREQATEDLLTCLVMNSDLRHIGDFTCSDEVANTLFEMVKRSDLANFYYFPTDCPHREKNGWTGDASMSADHMALLYDVEKSWREWLHNIRKSQNDAGAIPGIVPTAGWGFAWGNGPAWDSVLFNLPYMLYQYRGNTEVIKENAHAMLRYLEYILTRRNPDGTVSIGLGDWVPVGKEADQYEAPLELTDSIMVMDMAQKAAEMFGAIGYERTAEFAESVYKDMRNAIRSNLLDMESLEMAGKCQSSQALALYYGIFEEDEKERAFQKLLQYIHEKNDSVDCGFIGIHAIFHVLSDFGQGELAYHMITKREYPSYGHLLECGETALPESLSKKGVISHWSRNHHFLGDIGKWFMARVAGLYVVDAKHVEFRPDFIRGLTYAKARYDLPSGKVEISWEKKESEYVVKILYPLDVDCKLALSKKQENVRLILNCS